MGLRSGDIGLTRVTGLPGVILRLLRRLGLKAPQLGHAYLVQERDGVWWQLEMVPLRGRAIPWDSGQDAEYHTVPSLDDEQAADVALYFAEVFVGMPYGILTVIRFMLQAIRESIPFAQAIMLRDAICTQAVVISYLNEWGVDLVPGCEDELKRWITSDDIRDSLLTEQVARQESQAGGVTC